MKERFRRFMQGRYGVDEFSRFLSGAGLVCMLIATVLSFFEARATYYISSLCMSLAWFCLLWSLFRLFSRNYGRRYAENNWYLQKKARVTGWLQTRKNRFRQRREYRFFRCPQCSVTTRVPRGKGKIRITCHRCGNSFVRRT